MLSRVLNGTFVPTRAAIGYVDQVALADNPNYPIMAPGRCPLETISQEMRGQRFSLPLLSLFSSVFDLVMRIHCSASLHAFRVTSEWFNPFVSTLQNTGACIRSPNKSSPGSWRLGHALAQGCELQPAVRGTAGFEPRAHRLVIVHRLEPQRRWLTGDPREMFRVNFFGHFPPKKGVIPAGRFRAAA